jgi:multisubunit Na+/H+ antiporter MnhB subunit
MRFFSSHVVHFLIMGCGIAVILGMLTPTTRPERTRLSILKHLGGLVGIGLLLAWLMYLLPRNPVRF